METNVIIEEENILADFYMDGYHDMGASYLVSDGNMAPNQPCDSERDDIILNADICKQIGTSMGIMEGVRILIIKE